MHVFPSFLVFWLLCHVTAAACMKDLVHVLGFDVAFFLAIFGDCLKLLFFLVVGFGFCMLSVINKEAIVW